MPDDRGEARSAPEIPALDDEKRPSGLPPAESTARRLSDPDARREDAPVRRLRPPARDGETARGDAEDDELRAAPAAAGGRPARGQRSDDELGAASDADSDGGATDRRLRAASGAAEPGSDGGAPSKRPVGLGANMTKSARLRLQLALDQDDEDDEDDDEDENDDGRQGRKKPRGLGNMTTSARHRLQLALHEDIDALEAIKPPRLPSSPNGMVAAGHIPFDEDGRKLVRSLTRWLAFCGLLTLTVGALTGLSYLTGPGSVAHVVVGILASALSVWLLAAARGFRRVLTDARQQHHLINALGLLRSALLLKAILLFSAMVLGCFTFSIATALLFLL